jgi:hypothetical protein
MAFSLWMQKPQVTDAHGSNRDLENERTETSHTYDTIKVGYRCGITESTCRPAARFDRRDRLCCGSSWTKRLFSRDGTRRAAPPKLLSFLGDDQPAWNDKDHPELAAGADVCVRRVRSEMDKRAQGIRQTPSSKRTKLFLEPFAGC